MYIKSYIFVIKKRLRNVIFMKGVNPCYAHAIWPYFICQVWTVSLSSQRLKNLTYKKCFQAEKNFDMWKEYAIYREWSFSIPIYILQ